MVAWKTVFLVAMGIMFVDAVIQHLTGGGVYLQGQQYTFVEVLLLFLKVIIAFLGTILHAITHWEQIPSDLGILVTGLLAIVWFIVGSAIDLLLHFIRLPFTLLAQFTGGVLGFKIDLWAFGSIVIDFKTLTLIISFGNIDTEIAKTGWFFVLKNEIGFWGN